MIGLPWIILPVIMMVNCWLIRGLPLLCGLVVLHVLPLSWWLLAACRGLPCSCWLLRGLPVSSGLLRGLPLLISVPPM